MKIFLNEKYLEFVKAGTDIPKKESTLYIRFDGCETLLSSFVGLEKDEAIQQLVVGCDDAETVSTEFKKTFPLIEAAGGLVKNKKGEYLLIFRNGKWDLPKGKVEKGELIKDAAIREVEEECGIKNISIVNEIRPTYHIYELKGQKVLKRTHWFNMLCADDNLPTPQTTEGITEVKWMKKEEAQKALGTSYSSIKEMALSQIS